MSSLFKKIDVVLILLTTLLVGCASTSSSKEDPNALAVAELEMRLKESEQRNKRLDQKLIRLENELAATNDRVEAQKLAVQFSTQHQPDPVPESRFSNGFTGRSRRVQPNPIATRQERRIRLGASNPYYYNEQTQNWEDEEVVITQEEFERTYGKSDYEPQSSAVGRRVSQPEVTDVRLPVTQTQRNGNQITYKPVSSVGHQTNPQLYEEGLALYRNGDFARALSKFETFHTENHDEGYKDNALYWIGECNFALEKTKVAISYFKRVINEVPNGNKVPNAMLKMGIAYKKLGDLNSAEATFKRLVKEFGETGAGQIAKRELEK